MTTRKRRKRTALPLPLMWAQLAADSWETIGRRTLMMANGTCSPAEYQRMVTEKMLAAQQSAIAMMRPSHTVDWAAAMAPWHKGAGANARRLSRK